MKRWGCRSRRGGWKCEDGLGRAPLTKKHYLAIERISLQKCVCDFMCLGLAVCARMCVFSCVSTYNRFKMIRSQLKSEI